MPVTKLDIDISVDQNQATVAPSGDSSTEQFQAGRAISALEKTAPRAYAHLQRALASEGSQIVIFVPPHLIRRSAFANRSEESFDKDAFQELKQSIRGSGGNTQPIVIRPVTSQLSASSNTTPGIDDPLYEIVAGHRRYQCCRELGLPVKAMVVPIMSDAELILVMHNENHAREPLTAWEYGEMIKGCMDQNVYPSLRAMARSIGRDAADLSRALALVRLPEVVLAAFETTMSLQYKDADLINGALEANREAVLATAATIVNAGSKLSRAEVLQRLTGAANAVPGVGSTNTARKVPLRVGTKDVGSITWDARGQAVVRVNQALSEKAQGELQALLTKLLGRADRPAGKREPKKAKELT